MPLEQGVGHEALAAVRTLVGPLIHVVAQVQDQGGPLCEAAAALRADVRLVARVRPLVDAQVLLAGEPLVAGVAPEDPLARVVALVHDQPSHRGELRAAQVAQVLRRRVRESVLVLHVPLQQPLVHESLRAELARVPGPRAPRARGGLLAGVVRHQVHRQVLLVQVTLAAVLAAVQILVRVRVLMLQVLGPVEEAPAARLALEAVVLRVPPTMALQIGLLIGAVLAEIAGEHFQPRVDQFVAGNVHRAAKRLVALVAAERPVDVVQVLQVLHQLPRVTEACPAFDALVHGARSTPSLPEREGG